MPSAGVSLSKAKKFATMSQSDEKNERRELGFNNGRLLHLVSCEGRRGAFVEDTASPIPSTNAWASAVR